MLSFTQSQTEFERNVHTVQILVCAICLAQVRILDRHGNAGRRAHGTVHVRACLRACVRASVCAGESVWKGRRGTGGGGNPVARADGDGVGAVGGRVQERVSQGGVLPGMCQPPPAGHLALAALRVRLLGQHLCVAPHPARPAPPRRAPAPMRAAAVRPESTISMQTLYG